MPNGTTHMFAGLIGGGLTSVVAQKKLDESKKIDWGNVLVSSGVGLAAGKLPDKIEPAFRNPNHRQFFHSYAFGAMLVFGEVQIWKKIREKRAERKAANDTVDLPEILLWVAFIAIGAYLLHLFMDAFTKRGLPII